MSLDKNKYRTIKTSQLKPFLVREIRENILEKIKQNIRDNGYYDSRVLTVVKRNGDYIVVDGCHRLQALNDLGIEEVPCRIYEENEGDLYKLAITGNIAEETFAKMDLFDYLDVIKRLRVEGYTQKEIGEKLGWGEDKVFNHNKILNEIPTQNLDFCKLYQINRVGKKPTNVEFDFTEGWFRNSGLYELSEKYQLECLQDFVSDKCKWTNQKLTKETKKYKKWQEFIEFAGKNLHNSEFDLENIIDLIENNSFKSLEQLESKINDLNRKAKNKLICGDALIELENLEDASIDVVITDPPYGIGYNCNFGKYKDHITKKGMVNDNETDSLELLEQTCEILSRKTKPNAHIYIFSGWQNSPEFRNIIGKYFEVKNIIIWSKGGGFIGDLESSWGNCYEMIIYAIKGKRPVNKRTADIISIPKISSNDLIHPTQKPIELIEKLLEVSAQPADTICDCFMGSGSTVKAVKRFENLNYIGIEIDRETFEKAEVFING